MTLRCYARLYGVLALLRILIAFTSTSAIHPDEHFQNPEIAASTVAVYSEAGEGLLRTWEWEGTAPCRSIIPILGSTGWMFALLRLIASDKPTGYALFVDYLLWSTSKGAPVPLLMFAGSHIVFTFLLRPFSNSLETLLLAGAFYLAPHGGKKNVTSRLVAFGAVLALGVFTRITFVAFTAPLVLDTARHLALQPSRTPQSPLLRLAKRSYPILLAFLATAVTCALADTMYFSSTESPSSSRLILAPLNLLRYNLLTSNLAEHGLHRRYMHVLVNWPMLFGAGLAIIPTAALPRAKESDLKREERRRVILYLASFLVPTSLLSLQPHQEPRFLVPLIVPLALLAPYSTMFSSGTRRSRKSRKAFWALWLTHSTIFTILFGYVHQGGLLPALFALNSQLGDSSTALGTSRAVDIVFWRTFMPPRHLLLPTTDATAVVPAVTVTDLAGAPFDALVSTLLDKSAHQSRTTEAAHSALLVAPAYSVRSLDLLCPANPASSKPRSFCLEPALFHGDRMERTFGVHIDMDRLGELRHASWRTAGVGVWFVRRTTSHTRKLAIMSAATKTQVEAHGGAGDLGEQKPQKGPQPTGDAPRYEEGKKNAHDLSDSKDERSIANNLAAAKAKEKAESQQEDSTGYSGVRAAEAHGNKPSRGAQIDEELKKEDEELVKKKQT
ncbi:phosphatidylinositol glycan, class Z [Rhodotorula toruloides]|uniref:Mannosyltransferase n=1 Tax=Rhodotorula toruloides TaxID=5286 RepID=A0A511KFL2_RHOTO|nr:phosphatidylinositol glycan, class Z [Rhodotorula toruloides]